MGKMGFDSLWIGLVMACISPVSYSTDYVVEGRMKGFSLGKNGPRISHIFFANDSLIFCRAN